MHAMVTHTFMLCVVIYFVFVGRDKQVVLGLPILDSLLHRVRKMELSKWAKWIDKPC
jgi:hypothetical protein